MTPLPIHHLYLTASLSEPSFGAEPPSLFYVRAADGRRSIVRQDLQTGLVQTITTEPMPAGGVGYGGGVFAHHGEILVYAAKGGKLHGVDLTLGEQWALTPAYEGVAAPAFSPCGQFVAFLGEQDGACNVLLVDVRGRALPVKLSQNPWYAFNPVFSPDGTRIAWQEWDEANMPWDEARLVVARFARPTRDADSPLPLLPVTTHTIAQSRVSYASPQFSPDGKHLAYISDESGWRSLWVAGPDGQDAVRVGTGAGEVGGPGWVPGLFPARWSPMGDGLYAVRRYQSRSALLRVSWPGAQVTELPVSWTELAYVGVTNADEADQLVFIGSNPSTPETLVTMEAGTGRETLRATSGVGVIDRGALSSPEVISWQTVGDTPAWGILYLAAGPEASRMPRPLLVSVHGGPTSERILAWDAQAQYFATRGWHYLVVNHRGGTGFGRAYQELLRGQWGVVDVEDARAGAEHLIQSGLADPLRVVITGGSAGGYTTLMALTQQPDFWAAGVSLYGIGDHYECSLGAHRFEVNYNDSLLGKLPEAGPVWRQRSPLIYAANVRAPVLLFHGTEDKAVPYSQSVTFSEAVTRHGGIAELVSYEGEGHGFNREANRRDLIERTERFLDKYVLNLQK